MEPKLDKEAMDLLGPEPQISGEVIPFKEGALVGGAFEGARRTERALALWHPGSNSADLDIIPDKDQLDARTRDVLRNDAYVRGGANVHKDNIVGSLYALNSKPAYKLLGFDDTWAEEFQEEVEDRFTLWAESPDNWVDAGRRNSFTDLVRLAVGVHIASGEVLASVEWLRSGGRPFNTAIQMIDTDRLSDPPNAFGMRDRLRGGVERDKYGAPIAYHVRVAHPSDYQTKMNNYRWVRVPAQKPWGRAQMIHIFEQHRPDQSRGVAEMVSALKQIRMTSKFQDVTLQNAIVQATYAAAIESDLPSVEAFATIGGVDNPGAAMGAYVEQYLSQIADYSGGARNLQLDGVKIPHLFPGTKLHMVPLGKGGPLGQDFEKSLLRYIASALGVSYEQLTRDYSATNYSSARAAMSETWKRMNVVKRQVADRFASMIFRLWLEEAINKRAISSMPASARSDGWLYEDRQRLDALARCEWIGASKGQIDELKETQAAVLRLKYNLTTQESEAARLGLDWRALNRQRKREKEMQDEFGIAPDAQDNMMNAASGDVRESETGGEPSEAGGTDE